MKSTDPIEIMKKKHRLLTFTERVDKYLKRAESTKPHEIKLLVLHSIDDVLFHLDLENEIKIEIYNKYEKIINDKIEKLLGINQTES